MDGCINGCQSFFFVDNVSGKILPFKTDVYIDTSKKCFIRWRKDILCFFVCAMTLLNVLLKTYNLHHYPVLMTYSILPGAPVCP